MKWCCNFMLLLLVISDPVDLWSQLPNFTFRENSVANLISTDDFDDKEKLIAGISIRKLNSLPGRTNNLTALNVKAKVFGTKNYSMSMGLSMYQNKRGITNFGYNQYGYFITNSLNLSEYSNLTVGMEHSSTIHP